VVKIKYRRALHQNVIPASCPREIPCYPATDEPSISSVAAAFLSALPASFPEGLPAVFSKGSVCSNTFLPGSAQNVENDVTHSKQKTAPFLPGSRIARRDAQSSIANALSNRELQLLEPWLIHRKQTIAPRSNRH
jgi:hypothetical protein